VVITIRIVLPQLIASPLRLVLPISTSSERGKAQSYCVRVRSTTSLCKQLAMEVPEEPTTLSTFTCFPRPAPEIRLKIWCLTVLEPRILELEFLEDGRWRSPTPCSAITPASLHACSESRQEALKTYQQLPPILPSGARSSL
jgi:hypothetical protein